MGTTVTAPLSAEQIATYHDQGYLLVKGFVSLRDIERIRTEISGLHEIMAARGRGEGYGITWEDLPDGEKRIRQLMGSQNISATIRELSQSPKLVGAMEQLLGGSVELFHSKLMMKAAHKGSFTPWHSDWGYWQNTFKRPSLMNAFLAIDPSTIENGCIRYVPGSHREFIEHQHDPNAKGFGIGLPGGLDAFPHEAVEMEPGDVAFHGAITIHASEGNHSERDRVMNTFAYTVRGNVRDDEAARRAFHGQRCEHELVDLRTA